MQKGFFLAGNYVLMLLTFLFYFNRQGIGDHPLTCPADREGLDRDRVNQFVVQKFIPHFHTVECEP